MATFNKDAVIQLLKSYQIQDADITDDILNILAKDDRKAFQAEGLIGKKQLDKFWPAFDLAKAKAPQKWIITRFPVVDKPSQDQKVNAVIYGPCGSGKTSAVNIICGTQYSTQQSEKSLTREINYNPSIGNYTPPFYLIDTPGTTSNDEKLRHAAFLKKALTWMPLNAVFAMVAFRNRYEEFFLELLFQSQMLKGFEEKVVFLVTHIDQSQSPEEVVKSANAMLEERGRKMQVVYFSNRKCKQQQLRDTLYKIAKSMPQSKIEISEQHFLTYFNLKRNEKEALLFNEEMNQIIKEMRQIKKIYLEFANSLPNDSQKEAILQDLSIYLKKQLAEIYEAYHNRNKTSFVGLEYYTTYFTLQTTLTDLCTDFERETRIVRNYNFLYSSTEPKDVRDLIKQCPNCGLIWYRVEACPSTSCGQRPSSFWDFIKNAFFSYQIVRENGRLRIKGKKHINYKKTREVLQKESASKGQKQNGSRLGCGAPMNFDLLPRLPNIDEIINEWYSTSCKEELIAKMEQKKEIKQIKDTIQKEIEASLRGI